jgi:serine/threonine protein kinase
MRRPNPGDFESPPATALSRRAVTIDRQLDGGPARDIYAGTVVIDGKEWAVRLLEPRLQGLDTRGPIQQLRRRFDIWSRLDDHPLVGTVVDWGVDDGPWIVSEAAAGQTLADLIARAPIDPLEAVWLARNLCAVAEHSRAECPGPVAIRPETVLCRAREDAWHLPIVTEPGLDVHTVLPVRRETPWYVAPERCYSVVAQSADAVDIYRIAAICYQLLTGEKPVEPSPVNRPQRTQPEPPSEYRPTLDSVADTVLLDALAMEPDERQWTISDFDAGLADLAATLEE